MISLFGNCQQKCTHLCPHLALPQGVPWRGGGGGLARSGLVAILILGKQKSVKFSDLFLEIVSKTALTCVLVWPSPKESPGAEVAAALTAAPASQSLS